MTGQGDVEVHYVTESAQQDTLAEAVASHLSNRPARERKPPDPEVLALLDALRKEYP